MVGQLEFDCKITHIFYKVSVVIADLAKYRGKSVVSLWPNGATWHRSGTTTGQVMPDGIEPLPVTHVDYSSAESYGIHMWTTSQEMVSYPPLIRF